MPDGLVEVASGQPQPSQLTSASGPVVYKLWRWDQPPNVNDAPQAIGYDITPTFVMGLLAVQVNSDDTLSIEVMPGAQDPSSFRSFSSARRTYRR